MSPESRNLVTGICPESVTRNLSPESWSHYTALYASYSVAIAGALVASFLAPQTGPKFAAPAFAHRWREFGYALLAAVGVIGVGQVYQRGIRWPTRSGIGMLNESINQTAVFLPIILFLILRRHGTSTTWLPLRHVEMRVAAERWSRHVWSV